jgi:hypothetical protein
MSLFSRPAPVNPVEYILVDDGGEQFVFRHAGTKIAEWDLRGAIGMADHMAGQGESLRVVGPDETVLWHGEGAMR